MENVSNNKEISKCWPLLFNFRKKDFKIIEKLIENKYKPKYPEIDSIIFEAEFLFKDSISDNLKNFLKYIVNEYKNEIYISDLVKKDHFNFIKFLVEEFSFGKEKVFKEIYLLLALAYKANNMTDYLIQNGVPLTKKSEIPLHLQEKVIQNSFNSIDLIVNLKPELKKKYSNLSLASKFSY